MTKKNDGGPAFPVTPKYEHNEQYGTQCMTDSGMTLRDYFAGQALAGLSSQEGVDSTPENDAKWAYKCADAMLAARAIPEKEAEKDGL